MLGSYGGFHYLIIGFHFFLESLADHLRELSRLLVLVILRGFALDIGSKVHLAATATMDRPRRHHGEYLFLHLVQHLFLLEL